MNFNPITQILWWLAGSDPTLVKETPKFEQNRHTTIGLVSFLNLIVNFFVGYYAALYIFYSYILAIVFGIVWSFILTNIDRVLNASLSPGIKTKVFQIVPRVLISGIIAIIISELLQLAIFNEDIAGFSLIDKLMSLRRLKSSNYSILMISYVITLLILLIEIMPLILRILTPTSLYNKLLAEKEELYLFKSRKNISNELEILERLENIQNEVQNEEVDRGKLLSMISELKSGESKSLNNEFSFENYFKNIANNLTEQASISNQKAKTLLYQGIVIIFIGIVIHISLLFYWSADFQKGGFKDYHIYVLSATTLLFLFFEFLGGWFLKQYQNGINTSFYILKFKAVLDRYILAYLAIKEYSDEKSSGENLKILLQLLSADLKFPENNKIIKSFSKDAYSSIASLAETINNLVAKK